MLSPTAFLPPKIVRRGPTLCRFPMSAIGAALFLLAAAHPLRAASFILDGDPNYSFGATNPNASLMAAAISARMGIPITVVTNIQDENTAFPPVLADTQIPPHYLYGPSANGVIKNLNFNSPIVTGLTNGQLRSAGVEADFCGDFVGRFVLRVFSATQFYDVLVRYTTCSGVNNVLWSFYQVSSPRPILNPTPTPSPTPKPVQLLNTVSRQTHGLAGNFDLNLPLAGPPGIECRRTTGASGNYTVIYTFSQSLNSVSSATVTTGVGQVHDSSIGGDPHQYVVNLVNVANQQSIVVTLNFVQDSLGHVSNAVNAQMSILIGDVGANGNVGAGDVNQVTAQIGSAVMQSNFRNDVNHDGVIDYNDVAIVQNKKGTSLPAR